MKRQSKDWRENAECLRNQWMAVAIQGLKKFTEEFPDSAGLMRAANTMPSPKPGYVAELKITSPDYIATLTRYDGGWGVALAELRGLEPEFVKAYSESTREDMAPLAKYLSSEKPLGAKERAKLARLLPKGNKIGRPRNHQIRGAAHLAWMFYRKLREMNKASGVADWGRSDDMKLYAARAMVSDYFSHLESLSEEEQERFAMQVRELMEKSQVRRSGSEKAIIALPAAWADSRQKS